MKTSVLLCIDKWLIHPLVYILNIFVIILEKLLRIDHQLENRIFNTIVICKFKGLGSIIQATPLISTLKENFPQTHIIFISTKVNKSVLEAIPGVDSMLLINDNSFFSLINSFTAIVLKLIKKRVGIFIDLEVYSNVSSVLAVLSFSKNRLGLYIQSKHFRTGNYTHMICFNTKSPISETYLQFARLMKCETLVHSISRLQFKNEDPWSFSPIPKNKPYFVVNPNASDLRLERRWEPKKYIELTKYLLANFEEYSVVVIGGKNELTYVNEIYKDYSHPRLFNVAGKTSLPQLFSIIENTCLMISNDSGPMHIALSMSIPTIGIFGPCSPHQYGINNLCYPVYKNCYCSPCIHDFVNPPCRGNNVCMKLIETSEVIKMINNAMQGISPQWDANLPIVYSGNNLTVGELTRN